MERMAELSLADDTAGPLSGWQPSLVYGHHARVFGLAFHPTINGVLASAADDDTVRVWRQGAGSWTQVRDQLIGR